MISGAYDGEWLGNWKFTFHALTSSEPIGLQVAKKRGGIST